MNTDELLADMVYYYLGFFPDTYKFYEWAREQGYYGDRLQRDLAELNKEGAWFFVRVDMTTSENTGQNNDDWYWHTYEASEGYHIFKTGNKYVGSAGWPIQSATFEATCASPSKKILQAGQVVLLHSTVKTEDVSDYYWGVTAGVYFLYLGGADRRIKATEENLKGSMSIGSHAGDAKRGECDFKLVMPSGSRGDLWAINFGACWSRTAWVYEWRGLFE